jgi:holliday junction DNA helicase RuvA
MYSYLNGTLAFKSPTQAVIDVGGIGFEVSIPLSTYTSLPDTGEKIILMTHVHIREDAHLIFGFATEDERTLFRLLLSVTGIGPKLALTVLSGLQVSDIKRAILSDDVALLSSISGIGRKTAERIVIELREKVVLEDRAAAKKTGSVLAEDALFQDTLSALVSLGYKKNEAQDAIKKAMSAAKQGAWSVDELIRASLKNF